MAAVLATLLPAFMPPLNNDDDDDDDDVVRVRGSSAAASSSSSSATPASAVITFYSEQVRLIQREFTATGSLAKRCATAPSPSPLPGPGSTVWTAFRDPRLTW